MQSKKNIAEIFTVLDNLITLHQCKENLGQNEYGLLSSLQMKTQKWLTIGNSVSSVKSLSRFEYGLNVAAKEYDGINKYLRITDIDDVSKKIRHR